MTLDGVDVGLPWLLAELELDHVVGRGDDDAWAVRRVQEWLTLNDLAVVVDERFGPATEHAVRRFQSYRRLPTTGIVDAVTFAELTRPLRRALTAPATSPSSFPAAVVAVARGHRRRQPREVGGANRGPWVRAYMEGVDGSHRPWCAGFACQVVRQAARYAGISTPIPFRVACDEIVDDALADGRFLAGDELVGRSQPLAGIPRGSLFVERGETGGWSHVGIVISAAGPVMETIEGNTNDGGSNEGVEVCRRIRGLENMDFVLLG